MDGRERGQHGLHEAPCSTSATGGGPVPAPPWVLGATRLADGFGRLLRELGRAGEAGPSGPAPRGGQRRRPCVASVTSHGKQRASRYEETSVMEVEAGGHWRRVVFDRQRGLLVAREQEALDAEKRGSTHRDHAERLHKRVMKHLVSAFFPDHVTGEYWEYCKWRAAHRVFSAVMGTMSTQAMLTAIGVGSSRAVPAAAALNWVLKDGLGKMGKLAVTAAFGRAFDSDLKRFRFVASVVMAACETLEMLTPFFPRSFLLLASASSCGKAVALSAALAVQPAIHKSFATVDNMAEVTAKSQAQHVVVDNVGLAIAVLITKMLYPRQRQAPPTRILSGPIVLFPFLTACELFCTHHELRAVRLTSLNRERAELAAAAWASSRTVPSPREVSCREGLFWPSEMLHPECAPPARIRPLSSMAQTPEDLAGLLQARVPVRQSCKGACVSCKRAILCSLRVSAVSHATAAGVSASAGDQARAPGSAQEGPCAQRRRVRRGHRAAGGRVCQGRPLRTPAGGVPQEGDAGEGGAARGCHAGGRGAGRGAGGLGGGPHDPGPAEPGVGDPPGAAVQPRARPVRPLVTKPCHATASLLTGSVGQTRTDPRSRLHFLKQEIDD